MDLLPETLISLCWRKWDSLLETGHIWAYLNEKYIGFMLVLCHATLVYVLQTGPKDGARVVQSMNTKRAVSEKTNQF